MWPVSRGLLAPGDRDLDVYPPILGSASSGGVLGNRLRFASAHSGYESFVNPLGNEVPGQSMGAGQRQFLIV